MLKPNLAILVLQQVSLKNLYLSGTNVVDHVIIFGDLRPQNSEPRKLEEAVRLASGWFRCYFLIKDHSLKE